MKKNWKKALYCRLLKVSAAVFLGALSAHAEEKPIPVLGVPTDSNLADAIRETDAFKAGTAVYATDTIIKKMPTRETSVNMQVQQQLDDLLKVNEMIHRSLKVR